MTNLGVPFVVRTVVLLVMFVVAFFSMRDIGFEPKHGAGVVTETRRIAAATVEHGLRVPAVRWLMFASPFVAGVQIYAFYALQPYLLRLYGNPKAYGIAGLVAALAAGAQIAGGIAGPRLRTLFERRTSMLLVTTGLSALALVAIGVLNSFAFALVLIVGWGLLFAAAMPIRQAYLNGLIPSAQRATILSLDSMMGSAGGVLIQPALGRAADVWSYGTSYVVAGAITAVSLPFILLSRREGASADVTAAGEATAGSAPT